MWYVGIDLHRATAVVAAVDDSGRTIEPARIACQDTEGILRVLERLTPFRTDGENRSR